MFELTETITEWRGVNSDGFGGTTWSTPIKHAARHADVREQFTDKNGDSHMSKAVCYTRGAVDDNSHIFIGESESAIPPQEAMDVRLVSHTPSFGGMRKLWFSN